MKKINRKEFFEKFLAMLSVGKLTITEEKSDVIIGKLIWLDDPRNPEEIRWNCKEENIPSNLCFQIISFIHSQNLLDIDRIKLSRTEMYNLFCKHNTKISFEEFEKALEELLDIEFNRLENGEEFDAFFVHE